MIVILVYLFLVAFSMTIRSLLFKATQIESLQMPPVLWNDILATETHCFARGIQSVSASLTGPEVAGLVGKVPGTVIPAEYVRTIHNMALQCKPLVPVLVPQPPQGIQHNTTSTLLAPVVNVQGPIISVEKTVEDSSGTTPVVVAQALVDSSVVGEFPILPPSPVRVPGKKRKGNKKQTDASVEVL